MRLPPVVYAGPSAEPELVAKWLPDAQLMAPIQRGDLFRDHSIGFRVFLILDGVFLQNLAVSPREIIDVIRGGGVVFGASSMGALRAADCGLAGMQGIGSIFRMLRRGSLTSDDEVALALSPLPPYSPVTVPLVNVRYAASRLVRARRLAPSDGDRIVRSAMNLYFADRTWDAILEDAGVADDGGQLAALMDQHDLKRLDAVRALRRVRRWLAEHPRMPRRPARPVAPTPPREAGQAAIGASRWFVDDKALWQWLIATGRYRRFASDAHVGVVAGFARHTSVAARAVWAELERSGERDAVVLRFIAVRRGAEWATMRGLAANTSHRHESRREFASAHGYQRWADLAAALGSAAPFGNWLEHAVARSALAKRARDECFAGHLPDARRLFTPPGE